MTELFTLTRREVVKILNPFIYHWPRFGKNNSLSLKKYPPSISFSLYNIKCCVAQTPK